MFTGIIEETGILMSVKGGLSGSRLAVKADRVLEDIQKGDSIAVNGVCLTAYSFDSGCFYADVMPETLKRSNLARLPVGSPLNLERAMIGAAVVILLTGVWGSGFSEASFIYFNF